jgi:hypothetical protein
MNKRDSWVKIPVAFFVIWAIAALFALNFVGVVIWAIIRVVLKVTS